MRRADVVVVGGGVIGASCAYYLARGGAKVVLVERATPGAGASDASAGGVRQQSRDRRELPLAMYAVVLWTGLEAELAFDVRYRRTGHVTVAESEQEVATLRSSVEKQQADGLDISFLGRAELADVAPGIGAGVLGGSYCATDGHADPVRTTRAFIRAAKRAGARVMSQCTVTDVSVRDGAVDGLETTGGPIACDRVVNAAGAWGGRLAAFAGAELPITSRALQMCRTAKAPRALGPVLASPTRPLSLKQTPDDTFLIGGGRLGRADVDAFTARPEEEQVRHAHNDAAAVLPAVGRAPLKTWWAGLEAFTPDGIPVVGTVDGLEGMVAAVGFCGHGFALAPAVGVVVQCLVTGTTPPVDVSAFAASRLATARSSATVSAG